MKEKREEAIKKIHEFFKYLSNCGMEYTKAHWKMEASIAFIQEFARHTDALNRIASALEKQTKQP